MRLLLSVLLAGILWLPASLLGQESGSGVTIHVVQRGENLFRIALRYGLTVDELAQVNGISDPSSIFVGQRLLVPSEGALPPQSVMHIVQPGETLNSIAQLYGMSVDDLKTRNQLTDATSFFVGQLLDVSTTTPAVATPAPTQVADASIAPTTPDNVVIHVVLRGETLFRIATQYGVTVNEVAQANQVSDPTVIYPGQELIIPGAVPPKIAADLPTFVESLNIMPLIFIEGRTGRIHLTTDSDTAISGTFIDQPLHDGIEPDNTDHTLLVGIPINTAPDVYPLDLTLTDDSGEQTPLTINIQVVSGGYSSESIRLAADRSDLLDPAMEDEELDTLRGVMSYTPMRYFDGPLGLPAAASMSSPFGNKRSYNGGAFERFHTGTDFAAAPGTPIFAAAAGRVALVDTLNVRGNATVIDHGWGVYTVYCHQTEQYVSVGDMVTAGQVIGTTGSTGRVTGAHLHWELWVNGVPVDPMQWVRESFS